MIAHGTPAAWSAVTAPNCPTPDRTERYDSQGINRIPRYSKNLNLIDALEQQLMRTLRGHVKRGPESRSAMPTSI
jgi:hypothetical protein